MTSPTKRSPTEGDASATKKNPQETLKKNYERMAKYGLQNISGNAAIEGQINFNLNQEPRFFRGSGAVLNHDMKPKPSP